MQKLQFLIVKWNSSSYNRRFTYFSQGKKPFLSPNSTIFKPFRRLFGLPPNVSLSSLSSISYSSLGCSVFPSSSSANVSFSFRVFVISQITAGPFRSESFVAFYLVFSFSVFSATWLDLTWSCCASTPWSPQQSIEIYLQSITGIICWNGVF